MSDDTKRTILGTIVLVIVTIGYVYLLNHDPKKSDEATKVTTESITTETLTTEVVTEAITTEVKTEKVTSSSEKKIVEYKATTINTGEEETTGEINADGYGWIQLQYSATYHICENHLTKSNGSIRCFGHRETWYSTNEPGQTVTAKEIPGKHVADDGTIRDEDGFICVASSDLPFYSIVMTSVGPGKVYDCGCSHGIIDVYTTW